MTDVTTVANYILWSQHESGSFISNLKLQKLLYYVQAWHLAVFNKPLFAAKFEAWVHGPVIPELYRQYREYGWRNIDAEVEKPDLPANLEAFIEEVLDEYGPLDARRLEYLTHREDPWRDARKGLTPEEPCTCVIDEAEMAECYRRRLTQEELEAFSTSVTPSEHF